ncbi:hypothetical protein OHA46_29560 [Streptomyces sp. NBC_00708]
MIDGSFGADSGSETPHRAESGEGSDGAVDGAEDVAFDAPEEGPATVESLGDPDVSSTGATAEDVRFDAPDENHQNDEHPPAADDPTEDNTPHTANDALAETGAEDQDQDAPVDPWSTDSTDAAPTGTTESAEGREDPRPEDDHAAADIPAGVRDDAASGSGAPPEQPRKDDSDVDPDDPKEGPMKAIPPYALRPDAELGHRLNMLRASQIDAARRAQADVGASRGEAAPTTERAPTAAEPTERARTADDPSEPEQRSDEAALDRARTAALGFPPASAARSARGRAGDSQPPRRDQGRSRERGPDLRKEL